MSNLPPGVNVNMIPGNRPEDELEEEFWKEAWRLLQEKHPGHYGTLVNVMDTPLEFCITEFVNIAREMEYNRGYNDGSMEKDMADDHSRRV